MIYDMYNIYIYIYTYKWDAGGPGTKDNSQPPA